MVNWHCRTIVYLTCRNIPISTCCLLTEIWLLAETYLNLPTEETTEFVVKIMHFTVDDLTSSQCQVCMLDFLSLLFSFLLTANRKHLMIKPSKSKIDGRLHSKTWKKKKFYNYSRLNYCGSACFIPLMLRAFTEF